MKIIFFLSTLFLLLISCKQTVILKAQLHHSHCGGAPPTTQAMNGYSTSHKMYVQILGEKDSMYVLVNGIREVKFRRGNYRWSRGAKLIETKVLLDELRMSLDSNFVLEGGSACLDEWKRKSDGEFTISPKTDTDALKLKYGCYTGTMPIPCLKYLGPIYQ